MSNKTNNLADDVDEILTRSVSFTSGGSLRRSSSQDSLATTGPISEPSRSIPVILAESDYHLSHLSRLLTSARTRSPLDTHTAPSSRRPPPRATPEAERDALIVKNQQLASALNRIKRERNISITAEMDAVRREKELRRENRDLALVVDLLEEEVDRLSLGVLVAGTTPVKSPAGKGKSPTSADKKAMNDDGFGVEGNEDVQTPTKQRSSTTTSRRMQGTEGQEAGGGHGSDGLVSESR